MSDAATLIHELRGPKCRCGAQKDPGHTFCRRCYYRLSQPLRQDLYRPVGEGYEAAYAAAVQYLKQDAAVINAGKRGARKRHGN